MNRIEFNQERFNADFLVGRMGENAFKDYFEKQKGIMVYNTPMTNIPVQDFDSITYNLSSRKLITHEIKTNGGKSANISVQIFSSSKKENALRLKGFEYSLNSGIFATRADKFVTYHVGDDSFYMTATEQLKNFILNNPNLKKVIANTEKTEQTGIVLIPKKSWDLFGQIIKA